MSYILQHILHIIYICMLKNVFCPVTLGNSHFTNLAGLTGVKQ